MAKGNAARLPGHIDGGEIVRPVAGDQDRPQDAPQAAQECEEHAGRERYRAGHADAPRREYERLPLIGGEVVLFATKRHNNTQQHRTRNEPL